MKAFCDYNEYEIAGEYENAGKSGNKSIKKRKDGSNYKDFYYYGCKHRNMTRGHKCDYKNRFREPFVQDL